MDKGTLYNHILYIVNMQFRFWMSARTQVESFQFAVWEHFIMSETQETLWVKWKYFNTTKPLALGPHFVYDLLLCKTETDA